MTFQRILKCYLFDEDGLWVLNSDIGVEGTGGFNPHPARKPDATCSQNPHDVGDDTCFNPHPARKPDATGIFPVPCHKGEVSILIRPESRMQRR